MRKRRSTTFRVFLAENQLLLLFLSLLLVGMIGGSSLFQTIGITETGHLSFAIEAVKPTFGKMAEAWSESMLMPSTMLLVLFLAGLTAFGVPITLLVPLFFGLGIGLTQGYYYAQGWGGMGQACLFVLPRCLVAAAGVLMACAESFRMSIRFSRMLMPGGVIGGMWLPFRLYLVRFLLFVGIAALSSLIEVILRTVCSIWL